MFETCHGLRAVGLGLERMCWGMGDVFRLDRLAERRARNGHANTWPGEMTASVGILGAGKVRTYLPPC